MREHYAKSLLVIALHDDTYAAGNIALLPGASAMLEEYAAKVRLKYGHAVECSEHFFGGSGTQAAIMQQMDLGNSNNSEMAVPQKKIVPLDGNSTKKFAQQQQPTKPDTLHGCLQSAPMVYRCEW